MKPVVLQLIVNVENNKNYASKTNCQTADVYQRVFPLLGDVANRDGNVVVIHSRHFFCSPMHYFIFYIENSYLLLLPRIRFNFSNLSDS